MHVDIETFSDVDLKTAGVYAYTESPMFEVMLASYSIDGSPVVWVEGEEQILWAIGAHLRDDDIMVVAHNASFERVCFSRMLGMPTGSYLDPARFRCTMAQAGEAGLPQSLAQLAVALGATPKGEAGSRLIKMFCVPPRVMPEDKPEEWVGFTEYNVQDTETLIEVDALLPEWTPTEREVWVADQRINDRGVTIDLEMAQAAVIAAEENRMLHELEIMSLTGVANPGSQPQMLKWLQGVGMGIGDLKKETIEECLQKPNLDPVHRQVLELRQELAGTASKKFRAALDSVSEDGRLRGGFRFFGAHTGRWTSNGFQLHNMPRASLDSWVEVEAAIMDLKMGLGADAYTLKALVRALLTGPLTIVDYSSIEARILAWAAGERWALDAFRANRDIYVEIAQRMGGGMTRYDGKIATLALGYNGGVNSLRGMGAEGSDGHLQEMVNTWRRANPSIVSLWEKMGEAFRVGGKAGRVTVEKHDDSRALRLPSGRAIWYHKCKWDWVETQYGPRRQASFSDLKKSGMRVRTYGGRLTENITQAIARDILAEALVRLQDSGYSVVAHVHDEAVLDGAPAVDDVVKIMCDLPEWAVNMPIAAEGFISDRYRKG